jgi:HAE1 family hydrophobic/amphiphilic exporter-1
MLPVVTSSGARIPIAVVTSIDPGRGAERIEREDRQTSVWVNAGYPKGAKPEHYFPRVEQALASLDFPSGYGWSFGQFQARRAEQYREFAENLGLALLLIFAVMAGLFESVRQAIALLVALPFAISGAVWALYMAGNDFDQPAAVGLLLLVGTVVNNGIVMIEHINTYRRQGMPRKEAMLRGGRERLRPILMTSLTTLIGLVPMVVQKPSLGGMYYYSMAYVIMGGMALSTVLTAVFLPTTVCLVEDTIAAAARGITALGRAMRSPLGRAH